MDFYFASVFKFAYKLNLNIYSIHAKAKVSINFRRWLLP